MRTLWTHLGRELGASAAEIEAVLAAFSPLPAPRDSVLVERGAPVEAFFYLESGVIHFAEQRYGRDLTTWLTDRPQLFTDLIGFRQNRPATLEIRTLADSEVYRIDRADVERLDGESLLWNRFARRVWEEAFAGTLDALAVVRTGTGEQRYADLVERPGLVHVAPLNKLSSYIGVTPSSLSRIRRRRAEG